MGRGIILFVMHGFFKLFTTLILVFTTFVTLFSQPFSIDNSFQPDYSFVSSYDDDECGVISSLFELDDGSLRLGGEFWDKTNPYLYGNLLKLMPDGSFDPTFAVTGWFGSAALFIKDSYCFRMSNTDIFYKTDIETGEIDATYDNNKDSSDYTGSFTTLYIQDNGEVLLSGHIMYHHNLPDARYSFLARIQADGFYDTSFYHTPNNAIFSFFEYDENRLMIAGIFTEYDGVPMHRMARIYKDGTLDTTFHSIFEGNDDVLFNNIKPMADGRILAAGVFRIQGFTEQLAFVRLLPNGDLDSTFNNFNNAQSPIGLLPYQQTICTNEYIGHDMVVTPDNKILLGGNFRNYQGHPRGRIALTDINGFLDTTVFTGTGIDTCLGLADSFSYTAIHCIVPAQNNKYYIAGKFSGFNGQMVEPILRLNAHDHVGIEEQSVEPAFSLFPNPANGFIAISANVLIEEIEVFNLSGNLLFKEQTNTTEREIDISLFPPGHYILRATGKDEVWVEKFVVVR